MLFSGLYKNMVNKVTFAGFTGAIAPVMRLVAREPTRFYNKGSELKAQVSSKKKFQIFQRHMLSKAFCHFPNVRMRTNAFREEAFAGPQSERMQQ